MHDLLNLEALRSKTPNIKSSKYNLDTRTKTSWLEWRGQKK